MVAPPLMAAIASERPLGTPWALTAAALFAVAIAIGAVYLAPAYTNEQPLRRYVRALQDGDAPNATWEVASVEPGLDLGPGAPAGWTPASGHGDGLGRALGTLRLSVRVSNDRPLARRRPRLGQCLQP